MTRRDDDADRTRKDRERYARTRRPKRQRMEQLAAEMREKNARLVRIRETLRLRFRQPETRR